MGVELIISVDDEVLRKYEQMGMEEKYKLVRCRNCVSMEKRKDGFYCCGFEGYVTESDYCSWAVKK